LSLGVEGPEVDRGAGGEVLDLPFPELLAGGPFDPLHGAVEGSPGAFDRGQATQPVGVLLCWQVERRVGRVQVRQSAPAVGDPRHRDWPEDCAQRSGMPGLGAGARRLLGVDDLGDPGLG